MGPNKGYKTSNASSKNYLACQTLGQANFWSTALWLIQCRITETDVDTVGA